MGSLADASGQDVGRDPVGFLADASGWEFWGERRLAAPIEESHDPWIWMVADVIESPAAILGWLVAISVFSGAVGLLVVPWVVIQIPADYFSHRRRHRALPLSRHSVTSWLLLIGKNFLGALFVLAGVLMLVLPGQGILTILIGITLMDFPGKYRLERWLVERGPVLRSINWLRRRARRPPLAPFPHDSRPTGTRSASA